MEIQERQSAKIIFEERFSDSPFVERIWSSRHEQAGSFTSIAFSNWEFVFWLQEGQWNMAIHGPETKATRAPVPANTECMGIIFKHGAFMPHLPVDKLVDTQFDLPQASSKSFWLGSSAWQIPTYENADTFVNQLVRSNLLTREPLIDAALQGQITELSLRSVQRRFLRSTGLTQGILYQIERARTATLLLQEGVSILDTVYMAGYFDQPHLTRSLKRFIGKTPTQLIDNTQLGQLSFLYKTLSFA